MESPLLNFVAAVGIGIVIGVIAGIALKGKRPQAMWLAPVLALVGALIASVLALVFGNSGDYGWKEPIAQVVLALAGAAGAYFVGGSKSADVQPADN